MWRPRISTLTDPLFPYTPLFRSRVHRLDRIGRRGGEEPCLEAVARIDGIVADPCEPRREIGADMAAGGKAHHPDAFGIDGIAARAPPAHPHRALRLGARDIRPRLPAVTGQPLGQHIGADPSPREPAATPVSLLARPPPPHTTT